MVKEALTFWLLIFLKCLSKFSRYLGSSAFKGIKDNRPLIRNEGRLQEDTVLQSCNQSCTCYALSISLQVSIMFRIWSASTVKRGFWISYSLALA